ncbi:D-2-hydroxyacid dehydrogenase [Lottiidibacillus patelloidae]|uniref:D-2-hydroxyacid dehydrogenase n=1 Tax=Lottiidibacillus patelloidae TaxID=2670334 RepID=A0A263BTN3_9BACI|nr:D-2-hydroxyacid dehydrogenase [Lottiidibacillus patelloidae]OZM57084.1 D-2-hydroxyacid dehydrogenase [Lottiidibacillus patelloidae]
MIVLSSAKVKQTIQEELIEKYPEINFIFCENMQEAEERLHEASILITYGEDLNDTHLEKATNLRWIMVISAGLDQMPFQAIHKKGIVVTNVRGIHAIPMAEYVIAMMLQVSRNTKALIKHEQEKKWDRAVKMEEITGKTILVVGAGAIGQEIARIAKAFSLKTLGVNTSGNKQRHFDEIYAIHDIKEPLAKADFVVNVLPSTEKTHQLFSYDLFSYMRSSAVFINIGRGTTVNEEHLVKVMEEKRISHAVLDVFYEEPLHAEHPFWNMENVTVTPHLSGISKQYQPRAFEIFKENLEHFMKGSGSMKNIVNLERGY